MFYKIKPLDTIFFRDGRPFSMGYDTWANLIFPPYPSTIYGSIRSWLIFERGSLIDFENNKFENELGTPNKKGSLKINGIFIEYNDTLLFPIPRDLLILEETKDLHKCDENKNLDKYRKNKKTLIPLSLSQKPEVFISDYELDYILVNKSNEKLDEAEGFLDINSLLKYLTCNDNSYHPIDKKDIFEIEYKIGIKRNRKTLSSEEGYLYRIPMIRLKKDVNFFIQIEGLNHYPEMGMIQLGGEGRIAEIKKYDNDLLKDLRDINFEFKNNIFKLYLATPAIFNNGWLPEWIDKSNYEGKYNGIRLKLIGCIIGKYNLIGGWNLANQKPKPMFKAVPSGSIYYFKILNDTPPEKVKETFHLKNISDVNSEEGYGLSLIGGV